MLYAQKPNDGCVDVILRDNIHFYVYQPQYNSIWPFSASYRNDKGSNWNIPHIGTLSNNSPSWTYNIKNFFGYKMKL